MRRSTTILIVLSGCLLYVVAWLLIPSQSFYVSDTGLRFLQIQQLLEHDFRSFAISYPGRFLDPELRHVPYYYAYSVIDSRLYLEVSPFFPLLTAGFYGWIGDAGLSILPVLGSVLTGAAVFRLADVGGIKHRKISFVVTVFGTPLFFYALTLWDHSIATALALWGVYGVARGITTDRLMPIVAGGVAAGVATAQRPEMHVFALALAVGLLIVVWPRWKPFLALAAGGLVGVVPLWWLQYLWFGHPLGMATAPHLFDYAKPAYVAFSPPRGGGTHVVRLSNLLLSVPSEAPVAAVGAVAVVLGAILVILALRRRQVRRKWLVYGMLFLAVGYGVYAIVAVWTPIKGVLSTLPMFPLAFVLLDDNKQTNGPERTIYKFALLTLVGFCGLMVLIWPADGGLQWGARYMLPAYPLIVLLAIYVYERYQIKLSPDVRRILRISFACLVALSIALQVFGVRLLYEGRKEQTRLRNALQSMPAEVVLTNAPYLASYMTALPNKVFLYVQDSDDLRQMLRTVAENDISQVIIVPLEAYPLDVPTTIDNIRVNEVEPFLYSVEDAGE